MSEHNSTSVLVSKQIIEGKLTLDNASYKVNSAMVMFIGQKFKELEVTDNKIQFEITEQFENGNYEVHWNATINGKDVLIVDSFIVSNDNIDSTLPLDLQRLGNIV